MSLRCDNLSFSYCGAEASVLRGISLTFENPITAIIGPNGAGKSTLLRLLGGLEDRGKMSGRVMLDDKELSAVPAPERVRRIAFLSQTPRLSAPLTVRESVGLGRVRLSRDDEVVERSLAAVGLLDRAADPYAALSVGQRQLAAYARTTAQLSGGNPDTPRYLLADEPISALDPSHAIRLAALIRSAAEAGTHCVMVVHDLGFAEAVADRVVCINQSGEVVGDGTPSQTINADSLSTLFGCRFRESAGGLQPEYGG